MTSEQKRLLEAVAQTLGGLQVSGEANLRRLLGCLEALAAVLDAKTASTGKEEP